MSVTKLLAALPILEVGIRPAYWRIPAVRGLC